MGDFETMSDTELLQAGLDTRRLHDEMTGGDDEGVAELSELRSRLAALAAERERRQLPEVALAGDRFEVVWHQAESDGGASFHRESFQNKEAAFTRALQVQGMLTAGG